MILTIFVSSGFKHNIHDKIKIFSSDFQIINYDANQSYDYTPILIDSNNINKINQLKDVKSSNAFITKPAILKYENLIEGIVLKAYQNKETELFSKILIDGNIPETDSNEVVISELLSKKLNIKIHDPILIYFIQDPIRYRKLYVSGIFKSDIYEFDKTFAFTDIKLLKKIYGWQEGEASGYEITTISNQSPKTQETIEKILQPKYFSHNEHVINSNTKVLSSKDRYPQFYFWLDLFDTNVLVIIGLMLAVASFNLISTLLIIILEKATLVGLLKAFGGFDSSIRQVFLYVASYLTFKGLLWGNLLALSIAALQYFFKVLPLDAENYYISFVPIYFDWFSLIVLNLISILIILSILIIPSQYIARISPIKVIRFN